MAVAETWPRTGQGLPVLETPLLKVSRPVAACSKCRAAKIKCDGKLPACSACEKAGKGDECASTNEEFARGKERSYVATLETRVEKLEKRLQHAQRRKFSAVSMADAEEGITPNEPTVSVIPENAPTPAKQKAAMRQEARDIDALVSDFGLLTVNATTRDYHGFTSFMSYARLVLSACSKDRLPAVMQVPLPSRQVITAAVQRYMDDIYILLPFFDQASIFSSVNAVCAAQRAYSTRVTDFDLWSVRMILAITSAASSKQRGDEHYLSAVSHISAAMAHSEGVLRPGAVTTVQSLLFLVQYALLDPHHFDAWGLVGAASRAMIDLGLHQDPPRGTAMPKVKVDLRRRLFYCVYVLDRSAAINQARAFSFSDDSVIVTNPFEIRSSPKASEAEGTSWMQASDSIGHLIEIRQLQSSWYHELFQSGRDAYDDQYEHIWRIYAAMSTWYASIPDTCLDWVLDTFQLELLYSYVYILGPTPRSPRPAPYAQTLLFEHCISYATVLERMLTESASRLTFDDNIRAYMVGMQLFEVLLKSRDQLISGVAPEPPHVATPGAATAPPLHPLTDDVHTNVVRAITALKSFQTSLRLFSTRWGFTSWHDDYSSSIEPILAALNSRLYELQQASNTEISRRTSGLSNPRHSSLGGPADPLGNNRRDSNMSDSSSGQGASRAMRSSQAMLYGSSPFGSISEPSPTAGGMNSSSSSQSPAYLGRSNISPPLISGRSYQSAPLGAPPLPQQAYQDPTLHRTSSNSSAGYGGTLSPGIGPLDRQRGVTTPPTKTPSPRGSMVGGPGQSGLSQQHYFARQG